MARKRSGGSGAAASFLLGLLCGAAIGSAMGVLYAPHRGDVTRRKIRRRVEDVKDQVDEALEDMSE